MRGLPTTAHSPLGGADELCEALQIEFSDEQLAAICSPLEPGVIIAGAGSGKTTVMAARVVWLVGTGQVKPHQVLGLTFTRKAAAELAERVGSSLDRAGVVVGEGADDAGEELIMTYDSFAARLVAEHGLRIAADTDPVMITGAARYRLASRVVAAAEGPLQHLSRLRPDSITERVLKLDADLTSHLVTRVEVEQQTAAFLSELAEAPMYRGKPYNAVRKAEVAARERLELLNLVDDYRELKRQLSVVEFADQMATAAELVRRSHRVGEMLRDEFKVVLLDEYQDTSAAQADVLAGLFSGPTPAFGLGHPVTAVGDPFQAIYGWRGAAASNVLGFAERFRNHRGQPATRHTLSVNRRSGQQILDVANDIARGLRHDPAVVGSSMPTVRLTAPEATPPADVICAQFDTWHEEVSWLADSVLDSQRSGRVPNWAAVAVLVRRNADVPAIYAELVDRDIPVEIVGLGGLLRLPEVAHVVSMLRALDDVMANGDVVGLLSGGRWRIGPSDLAVLARRATQLATTTDAAFDAAADGPVTVGLIDELNQSLAMLDRVDGLSLLDAIDDPADAGLSEAGRARLARFAAELRMLRRHVDEPVLDLTRRVISVTGLDVELQSSNELLRAGGSEQLERFCDAVAEYTGVDQDGSLAGLLAYLDAELEHGVGLERAVPSDRNSVKLLTIHKAKGLEWDHVYLPSLVEGVFPSDRVSDNWVTSASVIPAELRGDWDAIPQLAEATRQAIDEYAAELKQGQRRSEDRLAYVAVTRARRRLLVSGHTWRAGLLKPRAEASYLQVARGEASRQGTLLDERTEQATTNPLPPVVHPVDWPRTPDPDEMARRGELVEWVSEAADAQSAPGSGSAPVHRPGEPAVPLDHLELLSGWDRDIDRLLAEARQRREPRREIALPPRLSASGVMWALGDPQSYAAELVRPMPRPVGRAALTGSRFHDWVARRHQAGWWDEPLDGVELPEPGGVSTDEELTEMIEGFLATDYADRQPVEVEVSFEVILAGRLVRGRIDAVYADVAAHNYQIVDWKTSSRPADPLQLALYREAWCQATGAVPEDVDAVFVHFPSGRIQRPQRLAGREELEAMLR